MLDINTFILMTRIVPWFSSGWRLYGLWFHNLKQFISLFLVAVCSNESLHEDMQTLRCGGKGIFISFFSTSSESLQFNSSSSRSSLVSHSPLFSTTQIFQRISTFITFISQPCSVSTIIYYFTVQPTTHIKTKVNLR